MSTATTAVPVWREPELLGQTVVVIGGSAGIGLETARRARAEGARLILTGRNPGPLQRAADELEALSIAAFDANDPASLEQFFSGLPSTIHHVMVTAGRPQYVRPLDVDFEQARRALDTHLLLIPLSPPALRSNSRPSESTSSPPASSIHRCRHRSSAMSSTTAAISFAPPFPSGAS
jgi:NAD(P)-dependent dehydrogenase (short-subunit alcohol dehydrogenase family)